MFNLVFKKIKKFYDLQSNVLAKVLTNHTFKCILCYILITVILSLGLFQLKFDLDSQNYANVRNSESSKRSKILNEKFKIDQHKRHFINKLLDLGTYVEIIVNVNNPDRKSDEDLLKPEFNIINKTILNEINNLYDTIIGLEIEDDRKYNFSQLCTRRFQRCSIENGLFRNENFQEKLLAHEVDYQIKDPKTSYSDASQVDGFGFNVLFGKYRKDILVENITDAFGNRYVTVHAGSARIRFDLLSTNEREKYLAKKFMHKFVQRMSEIQTKNVYKLLNFSYYASHTLPSEIEKHSSGDILYIIGFVFLFWAILIVSFIINYDSNSTFKSNISNLLVWGPSYVPIIMIIQFILTITSTYGLFGLLNIKINPITITAVLVLLITSGHEFYVINRNLRNRKLCYDENLESDEINANTNSTKEIRINVLKSIELTLEKVFVPITFNLITIVLSHFLIGSTIFFDSLKTFSLFTIFLNVNSYFGIFSFYIPFQIYNLKRINNKQNCFFISDKNVNRIDKKYNQNKNKTNKSPIDFEKKSSSGKLSKVFEYINQFNMFNFLYKSIVKYLIFILFIIFIVFNVIVICKKSKTELPTLDVIPKESYLRKHMQNHLQLYNLGPIIMVSFLKPINYWESNVFRRIRSFLNEAKQQNGINPLFEVNWLQDAYYLSKNKGIFNEKCLKNPLNYKCFSESLVETASFDLYQDDINISENDTLIIESSRIFIQLDTFLGTMNEVDLMKKLRFIAETRYNFSNEELLLYSVIDEFLDQLDELNPSFTSILLITITSLILVSFLILFDLKSIFILEIIIFSCICSILSFMILFGNTFNFVYLTHFMLMPGLISEFFSSIGYIYLSKASEKKTKIAQTNEDENILAEDEDQPANKLDNLLVNEINVLNKNLLSIENNNRLENLSYCFKESINYSKFYLIFIVINSLLVMSLCSSFNFRMLFLFLMSSMASILIHLVFFYPTLLSIIGTVWN